MHNKVLLGSIFSFRGGIVIIIYNSCFKPKGFGIKRFTVSRIVAGEKIVFVTEMVNKLRTSRKKKLTRYILKKYTDDIILNYCDYLNIESNCLPVRDLREQVINELFTAVSGNEIRVNDSEGYLVYGIKKNIKKYRSVLIWGCSKYESLRDEIYEQCGICILISKNKLSKAFDVDKLCDEIENQVSESTIYEDVKLSDIIRVKGFDCGEYIDLVNSLKLKYLDT